MNRFFSFFLFSFPLFSLSQKKATEVFAAEKSFAAYSVQNGTRAAFLKFADSNAVVFQQGKAVNALETWNKREARPGVLNWHPVYGFVAASGDFGFTSGPWMFQPKTTADSVVARGQYNTVWHKTEKGEWKFLLDFGVTNTPPDSQKITFDFGEKRKAFTTGTKESLQKVEENFIAATKEASKRTRVYLANLADLFVVNRNGQSPITSRKSLEAAIQKMPQLIAYKTEDSGLSASGDLGYVYGSTTINGKEEAYLRIWQRKENDWKLVLEVLPY